MQDKPIRKVKLVVFRYKTICSQMGSVCLRKMSPYLSKALVELRADLASRCSDTQSCWINSQRLLLCQPGSSTCLMSGIRTGPTTKVCLSVLTRGHESADLYVSWPDNKHQNCKHVLAAVSLMKTERNMPIIIKDIKESNHE